MVMKGINATPATRAWKPDNLKMVLGKDDDVGFDSMFRAPRLIQCANKTPIVSAMATERTAPMERVNCKDQTCNKGLISEFRNHIP